MKKNLAVLILSGVGVAILFAQEVVNVQESTEPVVPVPIDVAVETNTELPLVSLVPAASEEILVTTNTVLLENLPVVIEEMPVVEVEQEEIPVVIEEMPVVEAEQEEIPVVAEEIPVVAEEIPVVAEEIPVVAEEIPVVTEEIPVVTEEIPVVAEEIPVVTEEIPVVTEEIPVVAEEIPVVAEEIPVVAEEIPVVAEEIPVVAEEIPVVAEERAAETDEIGIANDLTAGAGITGGLISLSLKDVEMQDVVRLFSRLSNANIIVPDMLDSENPKRIDVNLDNVEWKPALKAILDTHGLELIEKIPGSEVYSIRERPADAPEPVEIKVFKLDYATVDEVVEMVVTLVEKEGGQISTYPARNSIVAQGSAKMLNDLNQIITAIDLPREQVFIEAKFLELSDSASEQLGIDWNVLGGYKVGVNGISGNYNFDKTQTDTISKFRDIGGNPYEELEGSPSTPISTEDGENFIYFVNQIDYNASPNNDPALTRIFGITPTTESLDSTIVGKTMAATLNADDFNLVMSALKEMTGAKIVSNPKIIVANEETASIQIGQMKPNIKGIIQTAGDSQVNRVYALDDTEPYFEDGVHVEVTPTVNTEENITVRIEPTLDRLDADPTVAPDGTAFWGKSTKTINTVFALRSGQTAAIGGLTEASKSNVDRKVPLLGDLPFLGRLFSYKSKNSQQVETIIFVTVGLANPQDMEFETGLPEDSTLAMRHRAEAQVDRGIKAAELDILRTMESERLQERLGQLRQAEQKRLEKQEK